MLQPKARVFPWTTPAGRTVENVDTKKGSSRWLFFFILQLNVDIN